MTSAVVVDDSAFMRELISRTLEDGGIRVLGTAADGEEAVGVVKTEDPDVVTMDVEMPNVDGLEAVDRIMNEHPTPTLMLSAYTDDTASVSLEALDRGAVDIFTKPGGEISVEISSEQDILVEKVKSVSQADVMRDRKQNGHQRLREEVTLAEPHTIVIGASTGGPKVVKDLLWSLPLADCRILVVQHMPPGFTAQFARRLNEIDTYHVREANGRDHIQAGEVLVAPGDGHLVVDSYQNEMLTTSVKREGIEAGFIPSVDVTMRSVAKRVGDPVVGVLLTGMGDDGVEGMKAIDRSGGRTIAQAEIDCAVYGMPRRAIEAGHAGTVTRIDEMPKTILSEVSG